MYNFCTQQLLDLIFCQLHKKVINYHHDYGLGYLYTMPDSSCACTKTTYWIGCLVTHKILISVLFLCRSNAAPLPSILKVNRLVSDRFWCHSSGQCEQTPVRFKTFLFQGRSITASLRHENCTEINALFVNKRPIRCGFSAGAKAIRNCMKAQFEFWAISVLPGHSIFHVGMVSYVLQCRHSPNSKQLGPVYKSQIRFSRPIIKT